MPLFTMFTPPSFVSAIVGVLAVAGVAAAQGTIASRQADEILTELTATRKAVEKLQPPGAAQPQAASVSGGRYDRALRNDMAEASSVDVPGTPKFFIGKTVAQAFEGFRIVCTQPYAVFQTRIEGLLQ